LTQLVLNPSEASNQASNTSWIPEGPIPQKTRSFGYCIDFKDLQPGDLILFSSIKKSIVSSGIHKVQLKGGYKQNDAQWEHAAVYIKSDTICEATRRGVKVSSLYAYMGTHKIRVRRNPILTTDEKWSLVVNAIKQGGYAYGYSSIIGLLFKSINGFWAHSTTRRLAYPKRAIYCSELYADAHVKACGFALGNLNGGEVTPASLSIDSTLSDVKANWVKIE
jgi:uncharacterized protein YycO